MVVKRVSIGVKFLDEFLEGGLENDAITTIYGPAGTGKTNLALLAAIEVAKRKKVIFVDTEGGFSVSRLKQILPDYKKLLENFIFIQPMRFDEQHKSINLVKERGTNIGFLAKLSLSRWRMHSSVSRNPRRRTRAQRMFWSCKAAR